MFKHFLGIDISKDSFDFALLDNKAKSVLNDKLSMSKDGFNTLKEYLSSHDKDEVLFILESTSIYHLPLLSFLLECDFKCCVVNPLLIKSFISSTTLRKTKNDAKDAKAIALFGLKSHSSLKLASLDNLNSLRSIVRERESLAKQVARLKTEIKANLNTLFPEMLKNTNIFTTSILNLLLYAPSRKRIRNLKQKTIERILNDTKGNKSRISAPDILSLAKSSIGINDKHLEFVLQSKIRRLFSINEELSLLDEELSLCLKDSNINDDIDLLKSIPGIGEVTSKNFLIETDNITRFKSVKQLCAYIGIDPSLKQSGSSINIQGKISKRGNANLRRTIYQMAIGVIRSCEKFNTYFNKKRAEGKKYKQAVIAVANKLLRTIFVMLKNKTKFDENLAYSVSK